MSIDWITVAAQIANFLVLIWLLKRFLYRPILDGIDAREAEIKARMQEAAEAEAVAKTTEASYRAQIEAMHAAQSDVSERLRQEAEAERDTLLAEAHARMDQERKSWQAHLTEEGQKYSIKLHRAGAGALLSLTRKALMDLADDTLEGRMAHHLIAQIKPMISDIERASGPATEAVFTSHAALPEAAQTALGAEFQAAFPNVTLAFLTDPDQAPGLVLRMGGAQVAWTVDSYLDGLDAVMQDHLSTGADLKAHPNEA
ncbi:ATP synthase F0 subcomplex B subunit [Celeribacter baekdonensis]|uniref:ATP synthase subunit b n=1 Tax=Celeribacter baekdonensis TaxID=875171 RepID=A0A1G7FSJ8_9RHOB|nr:F0F1 ATP synthase subunit B [Celeribacter baekdonensis]SDE78903.1 ATP synthase F0 subcomplex B subunit [Celeribacter baekdonensis]